MMLGAALQHVATTAALAAVVALACRTRRLGPVARHALWLVVLVKLVTPPVVVVRTPWTWPSLPAPAWLGSDSGRGLPVTAAAGTVAARDATPAMDQVTEPTETQTAAGSDRPAAPPPPSAFAASVPWMTLAVIAWAIGSLAFVVLQVIRTTRLMHLLRAATPSGAALSRRVDRLAQRMRVPPVPIRVVPGLEAPLIWATRRPMLLWPAALPEGLSDACLDGLVIHELAHVRRRDHWVSWLELAAGVVWWWNPLFWYVRSQVREHAELACDAWVVQAIPHGRRAYAEALVAVCDVMSRRAVPVAAVGVSTGSRRVLERRLVMIMRGRVSSRLSRIGVASIAMLVAATLPAWAQRVVTRTPPASPVTVPVDVPIEVVPQGARPARTVTVPVEVSPEGRQTWTVRPVQRVVEQTRQPLPADAQKLIDGFAEQQAAARREADAKIAAQRQDLVKQLQALQDTYTKAGRLDEAVAVRDRIKQLQSDRQVTTAWTAAGRGQTDFWARAESAPITTRDNTVSISRDRPSRSVAFRDAVTTTAAPISALRGRVGQSFTLPIIGATDGPVWGNGVYTDDSSLAVAAVHAGVVEAGKLGFARITILPGRDQYEGTTSHGIKSDAFGPWQGSFRIERDPDSTPVVHLTGALDASPFLSLALLRGRTGVTFTAEVVGSDSTVWGTDVYTDDTAIGAAAVHAGLLKVGERGLVKVTLLPGQETYTGSERNGVKSDAYGKWEGSFKVERAR